jgi:hypothetical protein
MFLTAALPFSEERLPRRTCFEGSDSSCDASSKPIPALPVEKLVFSAYRGTLIATSENDLPPVIRMIVFPVAMVLYIIVNRCWP